MDNTVKLLISLICICAVSCTEDRYKPLATLENESYYSITKKTATTRSSLTIDTSLVKRKKVLTSDVRDILESLLDKKEMYHKKSYSLNTIQKNGYPMLHIVNYNNGGWAIIAGNKRTENQILAMSENGRFDPDNITNSNVASWFAMQLAQMENVEFEDECREVGDNMTSLTSLPPFDDEYVWVRLPMESQVTTTLISDVGHLLTTKWGQCYPWNYKCPPINGQTTQTGCVAVAVAQLLYYYHNFLGVPSGLYHNIVPEYISHGNYYTLNVAKSDYNTNSARWNEMATTSHLRDSSTDYVGDLMIDIGERVEMNYYSDGSYSNITNARSAFLTYGLLCSVADYSSSNVISSLNNRKPVYVRAHGSNAGGHAWIIDGYKCYRTQTDTPYKWEIMQTDSLQFYNNLDYDYVLSSEDKERLYPEVYDGQIDHNYDYFDTYYLKMNWGYNGNGDSNDYNTGCYSWTVNGGTYNSSPMIIYGFTPAN